MNIQFYCRKAKINKKGLSPVEIAISISGTRRLFTTAVKCDPFSWPEKTPENIAKYLDTLKVNMVTYLTSLASNGIPATPDTIVQDIGALIPA